MSIQIVCPKCQATYNVPEDQLGKRARCKKCETVFVAAGPETHPNPPVAQEVRPQRPRPAVEEVDDLPRRRIRPEPEDEPRSRRRRRFEDDFEEDDRPARRRDRAASRISPLALTLIIGGVVGSLLIVVAGIFVIVWIITRPVTDKGPYAMTPADAPPVNNVGEPGGWEDFEAEPKKNDKKEAEVKDNSPPPPPPPRELVFVSPVPTAAATAPKAPANVELDLEVLEKVKRSTVHLRVTMGDGQMGQGSGFFGIEPNIILTNAHVVGMLHPDAARPKSIEVEQNGGTREEKRYAAELLGVDRQVDLAVLRVKQPSLPPPLEVKSAKNLRQTQRVWVVGFPFGDQLGREVTVSDGSVSSLRMDDNGNLAVVQIKGDMQPGNSGGPVVDALGNVVGVAVRIMPGTGINFAVPGDAVHHLFDGRISRMQLGQPFHKDGTTRLTVSMEMIDPLKHVRKPVLDVWTGKRSPDERSATTSPPADAPGDSPHKHYEMAYQDSVATAEVTLPALPPGMGYWIRPGWTAADKSEWATARVCEFSEPVELKTVRLAVNHQAHHRDMVLNKWLNLKIRERGEHTLTENEEVPFSEKMESMDKDGHSNLAFKYHGYKMEMRVENQRTHHPDWLEVKKQFPKVTATITMDEKGNPLGRDIDLGQVPAQERTKVSSVHGTIQQMLEGLMIPLPNQSISPGHIWQAERIFAFYRFDHYAQDGALDMTYTYLGARQRNGQEEAVISLKGRPASGKAHEGKPGASMDGLAVVDLATGQASRIDARFTFDSEMPRFPIETMKFSGTLTVRLQRSTPASSPGK
jgi:predicted Zn finger-like uncharacterized protein